MQTLIRSFLGDPRMVDGYVARYLDLVRLENPNHRTYFGIFTNDLDLVDLTPDLTTAWHSLRELSR